MATSQQALATVDFMPFLLDEGCVVGEVPTPAQIDVAQKIDRIMCGSGFLYIENLGVTDEDLRDVFGAAEDLFKSERLAPWSKDTGAGFKGFGKMNINHVRPRDLAESFTIRARHNDYSGAQPGFEGMVNDFWDKLSDATRRFSIALALALRFPQDELDFFSRTLTATENCTLKLNHYPPCDFEAGITDGATLDGAIRIGEHTDFGLFTFLFLDGAAPGLQAKKAEQGDDAVSGVSGCTASGWIDAPGRGGSIAVVNSGALLARWTNDRWRATAHRVIVPSAEEAQKHRYSMPFFALPSPTTLVAPHPLCVQAGEKARYAPICFADFFRMKLNALYEPMAAQAGA